jgi:hypothetical protein
VGPWAGLDVCEKSLRKLTAIQLSATQEIALHIVHLESCCALIKSVVSDVHECQHRPEPI